MRYLRGAGRGAGVLSLLCAGCCTEGHGPLDACAPEVHAALLPRACCAQARRARVQGRGARSGAALPCTSASWVPCHAMRCHAMPGQARRRGARPSPGVPLDVLDGDALLGVDDKDAVQQVLALGGQLQCVWGGTPSWEGLREMVGGG